MLKRIFQQISLKRVPKTLKTLLLVSSILLVMVGILQGAGIWIQYRASQLPEQEVSYSTFEEMAFAGKLKMEVILKRVNIGATEKLFFILETKDGRRYKASYYSPFIGEIQIQTLNKFGLRFQEGTNFQWGWVVNNGLSIFSATLGGIGGMMIFAWFIFGGGMAAMKEEFTAYRSQKLVGPKVSFADVAGIDQAKKEMAETVSFFGKDISRFQFFKVRFPRGVLLYGPPGTGKSLLARASTFEAGVPAFPISGSEFHKMFVGVGAAKAESIFEVAINNAPSMIIIDEADSAAPSRSTANPLETGERGSLVNRLLSLMDRLEKENIPVLVVLITNFPEALDPALLRPGRVDRRIHVPMPLFEGRKAILRVHLSRPDKKPVIPNLDYDFLAKQTDGFSGAELATLVNEAAINAAHRTEGNEIIQEDFTSALQRVLLGPAKDLDLTEEEWLRVSRHEAGHALATIIFPELDPLQFVSLTPRGESLGYTWHPPSRDYHLTNQTRLLSMIKAGLAGRAAEKICFRDITSTGAQKDIEKVTAIARNMVYIYGMSGLGPICLSPFDPHRLPFAEVWSPEIRARADQEVLSIINASYEEVERQLKDKKSRLIKLAEALLGKKEEGKEMSGEEVFEIYRKEA